MLTRVMYIRSELNKNTSDYSIVSFDPNKEQEIDLEIDVEELMDKILHSGKPTYKDLVHLVLRAGEFMPWRKHYIIKANELDEVDEDGNILWWMDLEFVTKERFDFVEKRSAISSKKYNKTKCIWSDNAKEIIYNPIDRKILRCGDKEWK